MQGQSSITHLKQQDFQEFLRDLWFKWAINALRRPYYSKTLVYVDTNAGSGYNQDVKCEGSPLIFLNEIRQYGVDYHAYLIEKDPALSAALTRRVAGYNATSICGDNKDIVPDILNEIPQKSLGLIYVDPNGIPDWQMIAGASQKAPKLDILIRFNSVALIRNHSNGYLPLPDYLLPIKKEYLYGKEYCHSDRWHWSFILGMNYKFGEWKKRGWYSFETQDGQDLKDRLTYKKDDYQKKRQLPLTGLMQNTCDTPSLGLSERKRFGGLGESARNAAIGLLRKFTT